MGTDVVNSARGPRSCRPEHGMQMLRRAGVVLTQSEGSASGRLRSRRRDRRPGGPARYDHGEAGRPERQVAHAGLSGAVGEFSVAWHDLMLSFDDGMQEHVVD